jgi:hypothetical protein
MIGSRACPDFLSAKGAKRMSQTSQGFVWHAELAKKCSELVVEVFRCVPSHLNAEKSQRNARRVSRRNTREPDND